MITAQMILSELEQLVYGEVLKAYDEKTALACAAALIECLYLNFKNQLMYIPTSKNLERSIIHQNIYNDFTGNNHKDLSAKYKISSTAIYKIINTYHRKYINNIQTNIFKSEEEINIKPITLIVLSEYLPNDLFRTGISLSDSNKISEKVADYLLSKYPGISICISNKFIKEKAKNTQTSLF